jgi:hypothetical protein
MPAWPLKGAVRAVAIGSEHFGQSGCAAGMCDKVGLVKIDHSQKGPLINSKGTSRDRVRSPGIVPAAPQSGKNIDPSGTALSM